jgi:hypothetical protein
MLPESWRTWWRDLDPWARVALVVWVLLAEALWIRAAVQPRNRYLYPVWAQAGERWVEGINVYFGPKGTTEGWEGFRYTPAVAVLFAPFHYLPESLGAAIWSLLNVSLFLGACLWWTRAGLPPLRRPAFPSAAHRGGAGRLTGRQAGMLFLLMLPLAFGNLNNGQTNSLVIALVLGCVTAAASERWNLAAVLMALAGALKVYPLAVGLLIAAVYPRRFAGRLLFALVVAALVPFLFQRSDYVAEMYATWWQFVSSDDRKGMDLKDGYRDLWLLFRVWHVPVTPRLYQGIQLGLAAACALLCVWARLRGCSRQRLLVTVLSLGVAWMMLCGPATESCTFIQLSPVLAWAVLRDYEEKRRVAHAFSTASWWIFFVCVGAMFVPNVLQVHALGLHPLAVVLLCVSLVVEVWRAGRPHERTNAQEGPAQPLPQAA